MHEGAIMSTFDTWDSMPVRQVWDGVVARLVQSKLITMALVELEPDGVVPEHRHESEQLGFCIDGSLTFTVDGESRDCVPGSTWRILSWQPHSARVGPAGAVVAEVYSPVRADWEALPSLAARTTRWPA
jgi:quercetin dioxygenase-like cupin family protein